MAFNFIGVPMIILFVASLIGILIGIVKKNIKLRTISLIVFAIVVIAYLILFQVFH